MVAAKHHQMNQFTLISTCHTPLFIYRYLQSHHLHLQNAKMKLHAATEHASVCKCRIQNI